MVIKKSKGKEWYSIIAPEYFGGKEIGKTLTAEPQSLVGKKLTIGVSELTNNFSKYYMKFHFKVTSVNGTVVKTQFDGSECLRDYISRMVLRRIRRIDTIQDLTTKDGVKLRVKGLALIYRRIKESVKAGVKALVSDIIKSEVENSTLEEFINKIISDEIKHKIVKEARKIYPLRNFEIRKVEVA